ncbi:hypothetical protein LguiA_036538 [Lonicera macranthoides]
MTMDDWIESALTDDRIVVDLLFRLKRTWLPSPPTKHPHSAVLLPPPSWGHRHPRSKPSSTSSRPTRCSPTTPLSWSAASFSDGYDDSSLASDRCRSKILNIKFCIIIVQYANSPTDMGAFANENPTATTNKRSRKRKTFMELKDEESLLMKEKIHLKKELASLHVSLKEQRNRSQNLKRIELVFNLQPANKTCERPVKNEQDSSLIDHNRPILQRLNVHDNMLSSHPTEKQVDSKTFFILPDLNMLPSEDVTVLETLS